MTGAEADRTLRSYKHVCSLASTQAALKCFDRSTHRLDALWAGVCGSNKELFTFAKIILSLSHGNASVERGFSINKDCLVENQKEQSLVAQRIVFDAVSSAGGVASVPLTKRMLQMVRGANARWKEELERTRKERADALRNQRERKRAATALKELELKKQKVFLGCYELLEACSLSDALVDMTGAVVEHLELAGHARSPNLQAPLFDKMLAALDRDKALVCCAISVG
ncbi:hypothetical protein HPB48_003449 [Haemaphysalis longicornis]|uniref:Calpain catalytic domain-containing protein n=1 Tax=Haemaphysalis longicornis TaxID=44386 RepID=A0A9J6G9S3_HAELO|nr:hypothetical protein HPB48_003449 [Haemaphysalis longicornis]